MYPTLQPSLGDTPSGNGQLTEVEVAERGSVGFAVYRQVQSCVKTFPLSPRNTLTMFRCHPQKCTMAQYFSQPFPKPGRNVFTLLCTQNHRVFLFLSCFLNRFPPSSFHSIASENYLSLGSSSTLTDLWCFSVRSSPTSFTSASNSEGTFGWRCGLPTRWPTRTRAWGTSTWASLGYWAYSRFVNRQIRVYEGSKLKASLITNLNN